MWKMMLVNKLGNNSFFSELSEGRAILSMELFPPNGIVNYCASLNTNFVFFQCFTRLKPIKLKHEKNILSHKLHSWVFWHIKLTWKMSNIAIPFNVRWKKKKEKHWRNGESVLQTKNIQKGIVNKISNKCRSQQERNCGNHRFWLLHY